MVGDYNGEKLEIKLRDERKCMRDDDGQAEGWRRSFRECLFSTLSFRLEVAKLHDAREI